jgi:hypothetical protein
LSAGIVSAVLGGSVELAANTTSTSLPAPISFDSDLDGLLDSDDPCPDDTRNACFGVVAVDGLSGNPIRLKAAPASTLPCANPQVDCNGDLWLAQFGARGRSRGTLIGCPQYGTHAHACTLARVDEIVGCDDAATQRVFRCGQRPKSRRRALVYDFQVTPGSYLVNFYFAAGAPPQPDRVGASGATIIVNGIESYARFDPAAIAAVGTLVVRSTVTQVTNGVLRIELHGVRRRTALRALEVLAEATGTTTSQRDAAAASASSSTGAGIGASVVVGDDDNDGILNASDPCPTDARNRCAGTVATDTAGKKLRINANVSTEECSGAKTDCNGDTWVADFGYNQSTKASTCNLSGGGESCVIAGIPALFGCNSESTGDLFQCDHYDIPGTPELSYGFSVPNGTYVVNLFFANTSTKTVAAGKCVFDIRIEGTTVYANFDQVVVAGGSGIAVVRSAVVNVADGNGLQLDFVHKVDNPAIKAIEVLTYSVAGCTSDTQCNDGNVCTTDACTAGTARMRTMLSHAPTTATDARTTCAARARARIRRTLPRAPTTAMDARTTCVSAGACTHPANTAPCADDGNVCTSDVCSAGTCTHPTNTAPCADDGNVCTSDVCSAGACTHPATTGSCTRRWRLLHERRL